jgi:hypothetical protein
MVMRDTATADGFQLMESSDHEKLKWDSRSIPQAH